MTRPLILAREASWTPARVNRAEDLTIGRVANVIAAKGLAGDMVLYRRSRAHRGQDGLASMTSTRDAGASRSFHAVTEEPRGPDPGRPALRERSPRTRQKVIYVNRTLDIPPRRSKRRHGKSILSDSWRIRPSPLSARRDPNLWEKEVTRWRYGCAPVYNERSIERSVPMFDPRTATTIRSRRIQRCQHVAWSEAQPKKDFGAERIFGRLALASQAYQEPFAVRHYLWLVSGAENFRCLAL